MVTPPDIEAQILRFYHVEKWTIGTIARQLHIHHSVVRRLLAQAGLPRVGPPPRPSKIDAYLPFIRQTLESFPTLTASRLYVMAYGRGYRGSPDHFRHLIACHRPRPKAEAYLRLRTLPGEEGQVDWGHFGHLEIGRARRPLMAFVMVLSYSRQIFLRFYHAEQWTMGTIARQLHIHHSVVQRVLAQAGLPRAGPPRPSKIDAYLPFIRQTLEAFPTLTATRLYGMVCERGYSGRPDHFRHLIACYRPRPKAEAYLRLLLSLIHI